MWCVTGSDVGEDVDNPVELILYGDKGQSQPVVIGGEDGFKFSKGQVDVFEVCCVCLYNLLHTLYRY